MDIMVIYLENFGILLEKMSIYNLDQHLLSSVDLKNDSHVKVCQFNNKQ